MVPGNLIRCRVACVCINTLDYVRVSRCRFYSEDANVNNDGYRAAGFTIELRDTGTYGFLLPPSQVDNDHRLITQGITGFVQ